MGGVASPQGPHQYLYTSNSFPTGNNFDQVKDTGEVYKMELDGKVLGRFGSGGHGPNEMSSIHQMDCRDENAAMRGRNHPVAREENHAETDQPSADGELGGAHMKGSSRHLSRRPRLRPAYL